ncbi:MAG TPA: FHA domain-containing protein, partial [Kofleriaceae bacterium]|nr:FHA domain-containing protein [Kofleriaceae bacterium]
MPAAAKPAEDEDERTTVDDPERSDRWEEKTQREGAGRRLPSRPGVPPVREDSGEVLRDSVDSIDEELTVRADEQSVRAEDPIAEGSGEVGNSTVDEPTVEDSARPLPPLSVVPPIPQGKGRAPRKPPASVAAGQLVVIAGNDTGRSFELTGKKMVIGRGVDCELVLTDIAVSRRHTELSFDGKAYTLRDLGSGNGTLINDRIEDGQCRLQNGDKIEIGHTVFR